MAQSYFSKTSNDCIGRKIFYWFSICALLISCVIISSSKFIVSGENAAGYVYSFEWGTQTLNAPNGIAINKEGAVYVTDKLDRVQKYSSTGEHLLSWGNSGSGDGQFSTPKGIAIDSSKNVYVVDSYNQRIQKFDANGIFIAKWGSRGTDYRQFNYPNGVALDSKDNVYVVDTDNNRIQVFSSNGVFINAWGSQGKGYGQLDGPQAIAIDKNDNVYVSDTWNNRVQKFNSQGQYIASWGNFFYSQGITIDQQSNVFVSDNHEVNEFTSSGTFIAKWGNYGNGEGQFSTAIGLAVDSSGRVFVADNGNNRIEVFSPIGSAINPRPSQPSGYLSPTATYTSIPSTDGTGASNSLPINSTYTSIIVISIVVAIVALGGFFVIKNKKGGSKTGRERKTEPSVIVGPTTGNVSVIINSTKSATKQTSSQNGSINIAEITEALNNLEIKIGKLVENSSDKDRYLKQIKVIRDEFKENTKNKSKLKKALKILEAVKGISTLADLFEKVYRLIQPFLK